MFTQDDWNTKYGAAMLELDPAKLQTYILTARSAIEQRVQELRSAGIFTDNPPNSKPYRMRCEPFDLLNESKAATLGSLTGRHR